MRERELNAIFNSWDWVTQIFSSDQLVIGLTEISYHHHRRRRHLFYKRVPGSQSVGTIEKATPFVP